MNTSKIVIALACSVMLTPEEVNAQGFLNKLKQKAQQAVEKVVSQKEALSQTAEEMNVDVEDASESKGLSVPEGNDIVPKRRTVAISWDGTVAPSKASTASALMAELPQLPSAEKMARCSMEERDAYFQKILAVVTRAEQIEKSATGCSDAETEALRNKWENKLQDLFGLTKAEMDLLKNDKVPESQKKPIQEKVMAKIMGLDAGGKMDLQKFSKMSEKEQEAYIKTHPEFVQEMQNMARNAMSMSNKMNQMTSAFTGFEAKMGKLAQDYYNFMMKEENHSYANIAKKYDSKLETIYQKIFATNDAATIDNLYEEADQLLYNYRLEAAKDYRGSLQRRIDECQKYSKEYTGLVQDLINKGELPQCVLGRTDMNMVISVGNLLEEAYDDMPSLNASPVEKIKVYELPEGWEFCAWECGYPLGRGASTIDLGKFDANGNNGNGGNGNNPGTSHDITCDWPMLAQHLSDSGEREYGIVSCGQFRKISEKELEDINKQAEQRQKKQVKSGEKTAYGTYKSRSGKRTVEYSKTGELIINGMVTYTPVIFSAKTDRLEWIMFDEGKIVKCVYKL